jgi:hypothetical protein
MSTAAALDDRLHATRLRECSTFNGNCFERFAIDQNMTKKHAESELSESGARKSMPRNFAPHGRVQCE